MKINEIKDMIAIDSYIDPSNLDVECLKIPVLHGKWYGIFMQENKLLRVMETELNKLYKKKYEYYTGRSDDEVYEKTPLYVKVTKQDLDIYTDADDELITIKEHIAVQKSKVDLIQEFIKNSINSRSFYIKDAIEFLKWKSGVK